MTRIDAQPAARIAARRTAKRRAALLAAPASAFFAAALFFPSATEAHGLVGRADLPVPSWLFGWAVAIVLVVSFVALATLWSDPRLQQRSRRWLLRMPVAV